MAIVAGPDDKGGAGDVWGDDLALIIEAAREAGEIALGFFGRSPEVWWKNEGSSPVSAADFAANEALSGRLRAARPGYGWLSEETDDDPQRLSCRRVFVVDPIDGTRAFLAGKKMWCVSIALVADGRPVAAALYAPALGEFFAATAGGAASLNGAPIAVAKPRAGAQSVAVAADLLARFDPGLRTGLRRVEHIPSLALRLAMVADGRIDATFVTASSHDWDLAAADLILERAGGRLFDRTGARITYNRASVEHDILCASAEADVARFAAAIAHLPPG